jgi:hypothetical protein
MTDGRDFGNLTEQWRRAVLLGGAVADVGRWHLHDYQTRLPRSRTALSSIGHSAMGYLR